MRQSRIFDAVILTIVILALPGLSGVASAEQLGRCYSADIHERIVLPDGSEYPPSSLKICMSREYVPGSGLLTTYINGSPVGSFVGRVGTTPGSAEIEGPFFLFLRSHDGALGLQGYAVDEGDRMCTYNMSADGNPWDSYEVTSHWKLLTQHEQPDQDDDAVMIIVLAD